MILLIVFLFGLGVGWGATQSHHDSLWGQYNHKNGRRWGWRPNWKDDYSKQ